MTSAATARIGEIAELAPQLVERDNEIRARISRLDREYTFLRRDGEPIPSALIADQRRAREDQKTLDAQRAQLLAELDELRVPLVARQRLYRSRSAVSKRGVRMSRAEFDAEVAELRREQGMFDRARNWLNGNTPRARAEAATISAVIASCHDPLSFDSNDW